VIYAPSDWTSYESGVWGDEPCDQSKICLCVQRLNFSSSLCAAGTYSNTGWNYPKSCTQCAAGEYSISTGSTACTSCPTGAFSASTGATNCTNCSAGTYKPTALFTISSGLCTSSGSFIYSPNYPSNYNTYDSCSITVVISGTLNAAAFYTESDFDLLSVTTGGVTTTYSGTSGPSSLSVAAGSTVSFTSDLSVQYRGWMIKLTASCTSCAAGTYQASTGSTSCYSCPSGYYQASTGSTSCTSCPSGSYSASVGATACSECAEGRTSASGASSCMTSPSHSCEIRKWYQDGWCDPINNVASCNYDGGDCCNSTCGVGYSTNYSCGANG